VRQAVKVDLGAMTLTERRLKRSGDNEPPAWSVDDPSSTRQTVNTFPFPLSVRGNTAYGRLP